MSSRFPIILRMGAMISSNAFFANVILSRHLHTCNMKNKLFSAITSSRNFRYLSDGSSKCWKCDYHHTSELFCSKCNSLQEIPENFTYFDIMGIDQNYDVSSKELRDKYRQLQSMLHPDKFINKSEREKQISESLSSFVNKAYGTLLHPVKRGLYILRLNGVSIPEGTTDVNPKFLSEIMERNERVEEASRNKEKVIQLLSENNAILADLTRQAAKAFRRKDFEETREFLIKMKYYASIEKRLKQFKQDLGIVD